MGNSASARAREEMIDLDVASRRCEEQGDSFLLEIKEQKAALKKHDIEETECATRCKYLNALRRRRTAVLELGLALRGMLLDLKAGKEMDDIARGLRTVLKGTKLRNLNPQRMQELAADLAMRSNVVEVGHKALVGGMNAATFDPAEMPAVPTRALVGVAPFERLEEEEEENELATRLLRLER
jgi:hypothetical protein